MSSMFRYCKALKNVDVNSFETDKVTNMECMFGECESLSNLDLSVFKTDEVINMAGILKIVKVWRIQ